MTGFPSGLSSLELSPFWSLEQAQSRGGFVWETEDADPWWVGQGNTGKLDARRLADWEGFIAEAVGKGLAVEFTDPVFNIPGAYRQSGLPAGWDGLAVLANLDNAWAPEIAGLATGLELRRGDRLGLVQGGYKTYHMVTKPVASASTISQVVEIAPPLLTNVFAPAAQVVLLNPVVRLQVEANSWKAPRNAGQNTVGSFRVREAVVQE